MGLIQSVLVLAGVVVEQEAAFLQVRVVQEDKVFLVALEVHQDLLPQQQSLEGMDTLEVGEVLLPLQTVAMVAVVFQAVEVVPQQMRLLLETAVWVYSQAVAVVVPTLLVVV
jgi:hypothetical protein